MIGTLDVECQAKNPNLPLAPMTAFVNSPSSLRIRNVPKRIGDWCIRNVYVTCVYPDASTKSVQCVLVGGVYVGTIQGTSTSGTSKNGYTIFADGTDENGNNVTGYILGKGDVNILEGDGSITPGQNFNYVHLLSAQSQTPKQGDMWPLPDGYMIWQDGEAHRVGGVPSYIEDSRLNAISADGNVAKRVDLSVWNVDAVGRHFVLSTENTFMHATYVPDNPQQFDLAAEIQLTPAIEEYTYHVEINIERYELSGPTGETWMWVPFQTENGYLPFGETTVQGLTEFVARIQNNLPSLESDKVVLSSELPSMISGYVTEQQLSTALAVKRDLADMNVPLNPQETYTPIRVSVHSDDVDDNMTCVWSSDYSEWEFSGEGESGVYYNISISPYDENAYSVQIDSSILFDNFNIGLYPPLYTTTYSSGGCTLTFTAVGDIIATEGYVNGIVGNINSVLDSINGEVI